MWAEKDLTPEQIESAIARIGYGRRFICVQDGEGIEQILMVEPITPKSRAWIDYIYNLELDRAIRDGLMTEQEILKDLGQKEIWTKSDDNLIKTLKDELDKIPSRIDGASKREDRKLSKLRDSILSQLNELSSKRAMLLSTSAERYAEESKVKAFIYISILDEEGQKLWRTWKHFSEFQDTKFIDNLIKEITFNKPKEITIKELRAIARSGQWRHKWLAAKSIDNLFGKSVLDLSDEQTMLVYWSQIYDSVYDAYERPPQEVIDDDEKLDEWLDSQSKKANVEAKKTYADKHARRRSGISDRISRHGEIFVVTEGGLGPVNDPRLVVDNKLPSKQEISELNNELSKKFLAHQDRKIRQAGGYINEEDLRSDNDSRRVIGSNDAVISIKRGRDGLPHKHVDKLLPGGTISGRRV